MKKNKIVKKNCFLLLFLLCACLVQAQDTYRTGKDTPCISSSETGAYRLKRHRLDAYYPENKKDSSTTVWFHGGGMEGGSKFVPRELTDQGFAVMAVNHRLSPKAKNPVCMEGAAEAVAWTFRNIEKYGGRGDRVFVSGHSAGSYFTLILAMDKRYTAVYKADADSIAAYLPVSGQTVTHSIIRRGRGLPNGIPITDEFAPVNEACKSTIPAMLTTGDKNLEMVDRCEKDVLLTSVLKNIGNRKVSLYGLQGFDHGQVLDPVCCLIVNYVKRLK